MKKAVTVAAKTPKAIKDATTKALKIDLSQDNIDGLKVILSLVLIQAAHQMDAIADMLILLPNNEWLLLGQSALEFVVPYLEQGLRLLSDSTFTGGLTLFLIGAYMKVRKFISGFIGAF